VAYLTRSWWNWGDLITYASLLATIALWFQSPASPTTFTLSGLTALMLWSKLLYYFRGFRATGAL
jgi:hypothetical protein